MIILPLTSDQATLESAGGKGANLARLKRAGFTVPDGFIITTAAYRAFVAANQLDGWIFETIEKSDLHEAGSLETLSLAIRNRFSKGHIPEQISSSIRKAYEDIGRPAVAVRSSATAEDLPGFSFAGQQDTYLNVVNQADLMRALVKCWSSLWTGRAIGYRARNGISHKEAALSVVVQKMVPSETSGVMFTANPVTGLRSESVVEAIFGLGEALVTGQVEPDRYVVAINEETIREKTLGAKAVEMRGLKVGGLQTLHEDASQKQALPDVEIVKLAKTGQEIEVEFGFPQDIEWAWSEGKIFILQARPITSLYPLPEETDPEGLRVWFSFGAVQGMLEPMTPLGRDAIRLIFAGGASLLGYRVSYKTQGVIRITGERLWVDITAVMRNSVGRNVAPALLKMVEPSVARILDDLWEEASLIPKHSGLKFSTARRLAGFALPMLGRVLLNWLTPQSRRAQFSDQVERRINALQSQCGKDGDLITNMARTVACFSQIYEAFPIVVPTFVSAIVASMSLLNLLTRLVQRSLGEEYRNEATNRVLEITRGVPNNVTTEMDLALWRVSRLIDANPTCRDRFQNASADQLASDYLAERLPQPARKVIEDFLDRFGMRGVGEIDMGRPRWKENPEYIFRILDNYLKLPDGSESPEEVFKRSEKAAETATKQLAAMVRGTSLGWVKAPLVNWAASRIRALIGLRESPKFYIMRMMGMVRQALLENGQELQESGRLEQSDDLFFLTLNEIQDLVGKLERNREMGLSEGQDREIFLDTKELIAMRREAYRREKVRKQVPLVLLSDGRCYYEAGRITGGDDDQILRGSPVSPGVVEGKVRIVLDPLGVHLLPGEILVCPATDPAWTPLFMTAGGLVMEVGGMMTHGSVVAREYGIPAVVGLSNVTSRLKTGQRIQVDGSNGQVVILADD